MELPRISSRMLEILMNEDTSNEEKIVEILERNGYKDPDEQLVKEIWQLLVYVQLKTMNE